MLPTASWLPEGVQQIDIELGSPQDLSDRILANVWCDASGLLANCVRCHGDDGTASPERGRVDFVERVACLMMHLPILRGINPQLQGGDPLEQEWTFIGAAAHIHRQFVRTDSAK